MSRGNATLLLIDAVWLVLLAATVLVLRREADLTVKRARLAGVGARDGLEVGDPVPRSADPWRARVTLFVLHDCEACDAVLRGLGRLPRPELVEVCVIPTNDREPDQAVLDAVAPFAHITGERARTCADAFRVRSAPFAIAVARGIVVSKTMLADADVLSVMADELDDRARHG